VSPLGETSVDHLNGTRPKTFVKPYTIFAIFRHSALPIHTTTSTSPEFQKPGNINAPSSVLETKTYGRASPVSSFGRVDSQSILIWEEEKEIDRVFVVKLPLFHESNLLEKARPLKVFDKGVIEKFSRVGIPCLGELLFVKISQLGLNRFRPHGKT
jgi:hypothetical protein